MEPLWTAREDTLCAGRLSPSRGTADEGEGVTFIEEPELSPGRTSIFRIEEDTSLEEVAMEVCDERADVAPGHSPELRCIL